MSRVAVQRADGITSYKLSRIVAELKSLRGVKKPVLRALADHYPNVFPSVETIAVEAGFGTTQTRAAMRVLEAEGLISALSAKKGGRSKSTQYILSVGKILAQHEEQPGEDTQRLPLPFEIENPTAPDAKGNGSRTETQRLPTQKATAPVAEQRSEQRIEERREQANADAPTALSRSDSLQAKTERPDVEAEAVGVESTIRGRGIPVTARVQKIIRRRLRQGVGRAMLGCAVEAVLKSMPRDERKPQFFLAQNLDAEVESIQEHGKAVWRATVDEPPRRAPDYLKEPSHGPLTGRVLEEHEKEMAPLRQKLGASEWKYPELPRSDR